MADAEKNVWGTRGPATTFFSAPSYRKYQREALEAIEKAFEDGYRIAILEAPTGTGKSLIADAIAFQSSDAYILTVQKVLQDQYRKDFSKMFVMKGRNAYPCQREVGVSCAKGVCRRQKMERCDDCPYAIAKMQAQQAPVTVYNFDSFYYQNAFGMPLAGRKLLIVDEAHNIENKYLDYMSFTLSETQKLSIPEYNSIDEYNVFLKDVHAKTKETVNRLERKREVSGLTVLELEELEESDQLNRKLDNYWLMIQRGGIENEYIFDREVKNGRKRVTFKPLFVGSYVNEHLLHYGDRVLLMSATVIDREVYCREIGVDPAETFFVKVPSTFPAKNRPIYRRYVGSMKREKIQETLPSMLDAIRDILDKHPKRRGIIHTHTEVIANYIKEHLPEERLTFNKDFPDAKSAIAEHASKEGSFLVASGLREGIDLSDDLSRVQVFCKVPWPNLGDKRVARKTAISQQWYIYHTVLMFVQAYGRSVRHKDDRAITYVLDSDFDGFYNQAKHFIPKHVKEAIVWVR